MNSNSNHIFLEFEKQFRIEQYLFFEFEKKAEFF